MIIEIKLFWFAQLFTFLLLPVPPKFVCWRIAAGLTQWKLVRHHYRTMASFNSTQKAGLTEFLRDYEDEQLAQSLAKVICKHLLTLNSFNDALDMIFLHSSSIGAVLNRQLVKKKHIFKYLHVRRIGDVADFSKQILIDRMCQYWDDKYPASASPSDDFGHLNASPQQTDKYCRDIQQFPIHVMARTFSGWFFEHYNGGRLSAAAFWTNSLAEIELLDGGVVQQKHVANGDEAVLVTLKSVRERFGVYFNVSVTHAGVQGRIDPHGMVLVLACGTLSTIDRFVGLFECATGLVRDPLTNNDWKIKNIRLRLKSSEALQQIQQQQMALPSSVANAASKELSANSLESCEMLAPWLCLPQPDGDI